jgi:hypothetical protein
MMANVIWKQELAMTDHQVVQMPAGAEVLHVAMQYDNLCVWFRCDPDAPKVDRRFCIAGTGRDLDGAGKYLGTSILMGGNLVLHVFDAE